LWGFRWSFIKKKQIKIGVGNIYSYMKLLSTIQKIIQEAEETYNNACDSCLPVEELDRLEKQYKDSLKLLKMFKKNEHNNPPSEDI